MACSNVAKGAIPGCSDRGLLSRSQKERERGKRSREVGKEKSTKVGITGGTQSHCPGGGQDSVKAIDMVLSAGPLSPTWMRFRSGNEVPMTSQLNLGSQELEGSLAIMTKLIPFNLVASQPN